MFSRAYTEICESDEQLLRTREREALEKTIELMREAEADPRNAGKRVEAIQQTFLVWASFLDALASPENRLSNELKASLISLTIFILRHLETMRHDTSKSFEVIIDPTLTIIEGLA